MLLYNLYSSPYIVRMIKTRKAREEEIATCIGDIKSSFKVLVENLENAPIRILEYTIKVDHVRHFAHDRDLQQADERSLELWSSVRVQKFLSS